MPKFTSLDKTSQLEITCESGVQDTAIVTDESGETPLARRMPWRTAAERELAETDGYIGGDGLQFMMGIDQCYFQPHVLLIGQDVGSNWISLDEGRSWWKPQQACTL